MFNLIMAIFCIILATLAIYADVAVLGLMFIIASFIFMITAKTAKVNNSD
jgi:hypothetical protein